MPTITEERGCYTVERRGTVAELTLSRPELLNRFDDELHVALTDALADLRKDTELRAIVLASTGKVFSAGGDIELMKECYGSMTTRLRVVDDGRRLMAQLLDVPQPIVVALQGPAIGLGASIVLACDAVVAARSAYVADTHVNFGLVAGDGGCLVWPQLAGMLVARRHLLTGDRLTAEDAYRLGMVTDLVDEVDDVLPAARALAERVAALPPLAVQGTKRVLNNYMTKRAAEVMDLSFAHEVWTLGSEDLLEAIAAFKDRRPASFQGR